MRNRPWWQEAVVYQIYPRSFCDSTGNGVGDLNGVRQRLDHIAWLGADAIWLSPIYRSPMHDFGYDVSDYCDIDPIFGDLDDLDALISEAHASGLRVILDWIPSHTSSEHPWFRESRSSRMDPKRDWYVWRDPRPGGDVPNNWKGAFAKGGPAWSLDEATGQYWLHSFLPEQPDLNWENPEVVSAMQDTLRFWLDRGVDGFRADVVHNIGKDPALKDVPPELAPIPHCALNDDARTIPHLRGLRRLLDSYKGDRVMVGEVFLMNTEQVGPYYDEGRGLHLAFNFPPMFNDWKAENWRASIEEAARVFDPIGAWPTWVLSNHDWPRHRTRLGSDARARASAVLLLTLRGTPFLYMGEELGLEDAIVPAERQVDPGGRDGCRGPIPWSRAPGHGWTDPAWLPLPPAADRFNAEAERDDPTAILHLYRRILRTRSRSEALREGSLELLSGMPAEALGYDRRHEDDHRRVLLNFSSQPCGVGGSENFVIEVSSQHTVEGTPFSGTLSPDEAVVLRPA